MSDETTEVEEEEEVTESVDDLLEQAYSKLSILEEELKLKIAKHFYDNGRWEYPEDPKPVMDVSAVDFAEASAAAEKEETTPFLDEKEDTTPPVVSAFSIPDNK